MKKTKILAYLDSPACFSGFAQVARNILTELHNTGQYEITVFGINHPLLEDEYSRPQEHGYPFEILDARHLSNADLKKGFEPNIYGRDKLLKLMFEMDFDIFFSIQDPFVVDFVADGLHRLREKHGKKFRSIFYFPVDGYDVPAQWFSIAYGFDFPVVYTDFGMKEISKKVKPEFMSKFCKPIPHGTNIVDFKPLENRSEIKQKFFADKFVCLNVNRNQPRKDPCRSLSVFAEFKKKVPNAVYLFYCNPYDIGNNLVKELKYYGLKVNRDVFFPEALTKAGMKGMDISEINETYNIADLMFSTTLGEGWGLSTTEAMATRVPLVIPRNTSNIEIVGENEERGYLADSGSNVNLWQVNQRVVDEPPRPLTDIESMVEKMLKVHADITGGKPFAETDTGKKVEAAYQYAIENTWENIVKSQWLPLFDKARKELEADNKKA